MGVSIMQFNRFKNNAEFSNLLSQKVLMNYYVDELKKFTLKVVLYLTLSKAVIQWQGRGHRHEAMANYSHADIQYNSATSSEILLLYKG